MPRSKLPPPSYTKPIPLPTFTLSWKNSLITYAGGGGSAKTGVSNKIIILSDYNQPVEIDTKESLCAAVTISHINGSNLLAAGVDKILKFYNTTNGTEEVLHETECSTNGFINAIAFSNNGKYICLGCEDGTVDFWNVAMRTRISISEKGSHSNKAVCAVCWSPDDKHVVSSGKDGTARVWNVKTGKALYVFKCKIGENAIEEKKFESKPILVRGCRYLSDGTIITIASSKRGKAFLSKWDQGKELVRICCSQVPISAMDISHDHEFLVLGSVEGSITIMNATTYKIIKKFEEVHDLPVTCIAAIPAQISEKHQYISVISASADNKMAYLSLSKFRNPNHWIMDFFLLFVVVLVAGIVKYCYKECNDDIYTYGLSNSFGCMKDVVFADTENQPWILDPPY